MGDAESNLKEKGYIVTDLQGRGREVILEGKHWFWYIPLKFLDGLVVGIIYGGYKQVKGGESGVEINTGWNALGTGGGAITGRDGINFIKHLD